MFWKQIQVTICCILYYGRLQGEQFYHTESLHPTTFFVPTVMLKTYDKRDIP